MTMRGENNHLFTITKLVPSRTVSALVKSSTNLVPVRAAWADTPAKTVLGAILLAACFVAWALVL